LSKILSTPQYELRNRSKLLVVGLVSAAILLCFPGINDLALGQFYPDRFIVLFLPLTMIYIEKLVVVNDRRTNLIFVTLAILSMSVTERGSLYVAFVSLFLLIFRVIRNRDRLRKTLRKNTSILLVSVTALLWTRVYVSKIARNQDTEGFIHSFTHFSSINSHVFSTPSLKMLILSLPLILVVAKYQDLF
jgi:hypothetical protein